jgi:hypothetical protein
VYKAAAPVLHLTPDRLEALLKSGKSLADVAKLQHIDAKLVKDALLTAIKTQLDAAVQRGSLSRTEADSIYKKIDGSIDQLMSMRGGV